MYNFWFSNQAMHKVTFISSLEKFYCLINYFFFNLQEVIQWNSNHNAFEVMDNIVSVYQPEHPTGIQFLLDNPLQLQDMVLAEKLQHPEAIIDLSAPSSHPCKIVAFNRVCHFIHIRQLHVRFLPSTGESTILLLPSEEKNRFSHLTTDVNKDISDWSLIPPFVKELLEIPQNTEHVGDYILLVYGRLGAWELAGCLDSLSPVRQQDPPAEAIIDSQEFQTKSSFSYPSEVYFMAFNLCFLI